MTVVTDDPHDPLKNQPPTGDAREAGFRRAFEDHYRPVLAFVSRRLSAREQVQDVVADVFLVAWRRWDEVPKGDELRLWLYGTARLVISNYRRSSQRSLRLESRVLSMPDASAHDDFKVDDQADLKDAITALNRLSDMDRDLILMSVWDDLSNSEIAQLLEVSRPAVAVKLHRAKQRLREQFQQALKSETAPGHVYDMNKARKAKGADGQ